MSNVKMKTVDQLYVSSVGPDTMDPETEFEVSESEAKRLEEAGLAKRVGGAKAEPATPENKMEAAPANKIVTFDHDGDGKPGGSAIGKESTRAKGAAKKGKK